MVDPRIEAIRADYYVGRGSHTITDDCIGDDDLSAALDDENVDRTAHAALRWAHAYHLRTLQQELECADERCECDAVLAAAELAEFRKTMVR